MQKITVRISDSTVEKMFPLTNSEQSTPTSIATFLVEWGVATLNRSQKTALAKLDTEERRAVIGVCNGWMITSTPLHDNRVLKHELEDFFSMGDGTMWSWEQNRINTLIEKISGLSPDQAMALILWAKHFWSKNNEDLETYLEEK